jgi:hypothetical protein
MKIAILATTVISLGLFGLEANADPSEKLIKRDREWGEATKPEQLKNLLTEKFILLDEDGTSSRQDLMDELAKDGGPKEPYVAGGYKVTMIDDKIAIMTHSAGSGSDKHNSMHVWRKHDGKWKVAASATVPIDD